MTGVHEDINDVSNTRRVQRANNRGGDSATFNTFGRQADFYLSIHTNAVGNENNVFLSAHGLETVIHPSGADTASETYAEIIDGEVKNLGYGQVVRSMKLINVEVLRTTLMPSVLYEGGFFTNFTDTILLMDDMYRRRTAECLANAVDKIYAHWRSNRL